LELKRKKESVKLQVTGSPPRWISRIR
jgi:hypothetical protein